MPYILNVQGIQSILTEDHSSGMMPHWGHRVAQLVEALRYKLEGHGFDSRWFHCNFSLRQSFRPNYGPGVDSAFNRKEYQEYFMGCKGSWCIGLKTLPNSCNDCHEIWEPLPHATLWACPGLQWDCFTFYLYDATLTCSLIDVLEELPISISDSHSFMSLGPSPSGLLGVLKVKTVSFCDT